jgi:DNA (cytosine-5)-methyltransferase 1
MEVFARLMVLRLSLSRVSLVVHLVSQDLSIAGKRAGLAGERSGLFMEMIRVIKEMRDATNGECPKFAIWENVRGALSSNNGEDFRCVLEEFAHIVEADATIPKPSGKGGKWSKSGAISGNGWSLAWRLFDAQYWGVPQRRQRIALVMDFRGQRAAEILFERTGVPGNPDESIPTWQSFARITEECTAKDDRVVGEKSFCIVGNMIDRETNMNGTGVKEDTAFTINTIDRNAVAYTLKIRSGCEGGGKGALVQTEKSATLSTLQDQTLICLADNTSLHNSKQKICVLNDQGGSVMNVSYDIVGTIRAQEHGHQPIVFESHSQDARYTQQGNTSPACTAQWGTGGNNMPLVAEKKAFAMQRIGEYKESEQASTMKSRDYKDATDLIAEKETKNLQWIVRRLTPVECERLQGFPDGWTDIGEWFDENGKKHKPADSPRYKALGNSIALPQWYWIFQKMKPYIGENPTLGSLFDGIGGFPLVFESTYGDGTAIWGSEIEPFCVAVTKKHFPEKQRG